MADSPDIEIVTPAPRRSRTGNRVTALRWAGLLRELGARVRVTERWSGALRDLLIALHADKSGASIREFAERVPGVPVVCALTGTDVYGELQGSSEALRTLGLAHRIVALQPEATAHLPEALRGRVRTILQSAPS